MPHIDEGNLNALLDGALAGGVAAELREHLQLCANCRARLDEAERIRDQADAILAGAAPVAAAPPAFEEILARARAVGVPASPPRPSAPVRLTAPRTLAWAASLVLALAGGWWAHELTLGPALRSGPLERVTARGNAAPPVATGLAAAPTRNAPNAPALGATAPGVAAMEPAAPAGRVQTAGAPAGVAGAAPFAGLGAAPARAVEQPAAASAPPPGAAPGATAAASADMTVRGYAANPGPEQAKAAEGAPGVAAKSMMMQEVAPAPAQRSAVVADAAPQPAAPGVYSGGAEARDLLGRSVEWGPTYTPYTVAPEPLNREEVRRALVREYPAEARDNGRGGTTRLWLLVDVTGIVRSAQVRISSGDPRIDLAALRVARSFRFSPARLRDQPVAVWVSVPITFRPGGIPLPADSQVNLSPAPELAPRRSDVANPGSPR